MRRKLVVGNWKMNGDLGRNRALLEAIAAQAPADIDCAVCVPFPYLAQAQGVLAGGRVGVGAQDVSEFADGAYTGEVSAGMLREFGCRYVIVGHSERRAMFCDDDALVGRKALAAIRAGLVPIACVGETFAEREAGRAEAVLQRQIDAIAGELDAESLAKVVIAYEPVWAIGTGRAASPAQVQTVLEFIRVQLARRTPAAAGVRILYGGSVKPDGAEALFGLADSDGGLIGGASLVSDQFLDICKAAGAASLANQRQFEGSK